MGNDHNHQHAFVKNQWELIEKNVTYTLWRNRKDKNKQLQQYDVFSRGEEQFKQEKHVFHFRYNHQHLVSAHYFQDYQDQEFCSTSHRYGLFIQKIPIRLTDIEHIPFPDYLHLYYQALMGFRDIARQYGCFEVQEEYIGVNEGGVVKVWLNRDYSKNFIVGGRITEEQMVKGVIDIIDSNCDNNRNNGIPSVRNYLYRNSDLLKFDQALRELQSYLLTYCQGNCPTTLQCIDRVGGIQVIINRQYIEEQNNNKQKQLIVQRPPQFQRHNLVSEQQLVNPHPHPKSLPLHQDIPVQQRPSVNYQLKGSEVLPTPKREEFIIKPQIIKQNMQVVRRRKSEHQPIPLKIESSKPMKYSQTIGQVPTNNWVTSPVKAQPGKISFVVSPNKSPQTQIYSQANPVMKISQNSHPHPPINRTINPQPNQQITFKKITNSSNFPQQVANNTSIANTSGSNSQRVVLRASNQPPDQQYVQPHIQPPAQQPFSQPIVQVSRQNQVLPIQDKRVEQLKPQQQRIKVNDDVLSLQQQRQKRTDFSLNKELKQEQKVQVVDDSNKNEDTFKYGERQISNQTVNLNQDNNSFSNSPAKKVSSQSYSRDDGKSSEEFMRKLRQITSGIQMNQYQSNNQYQFSMNQSSSNPTYTNSSPYHHPKYEYESVDPYGNMHIDDQDFGRAAQSNIVFTQESNSKNSLRKQSEPLKFEKGLQMKYSRLQPEEQQAKVNKKSLRQYQSNIDSDLLADLHQLKA